MSTVYVFLVVLQSEAMPSGSGRKLFKVNSMNKINLWKLTYSLGIFFFRELGFTATPSQVYPGYQIGFTALSS